MDEDKNTIRQGTMTEARLKVSLIACPDNPLAVIYAAYRQCYSAQSAADICAQAEEEPDSAGRFVQRMVSTGHESPLEHASFTFVIEGISRAATHQLVRHRIASFSQQSQRYVNEETFEYIVPPAIARDSALLAEFTEAMEAARVSYARITALLNERGIEGSSANEDARYVLPQAVETKIVVTMNCRELLHFFALRCCARAQWEIRAAARKMLELCRERLPSVFASAGARCEALGYCPEDEKFSCGRFPPGSSMRPESKH